MNNRPQDSGQDKYKDKRNETGQPALDTNNVFDLEEEDESNE